MPGLRLVLDLAGIAALSLVFWRFARPAARDAIEPPPPPPERVRRTGLTLAAAGWILLSACAVALYRDWDANLLHVFAAGPVGLGLLALGLDLARGYGSRWSPRWPRSWNRWEALGLAVVLAAGFFFRFSSFGYYPPPDGFSSLEETQLANSAQSVLTESKRPWEWPLSIYIPAASFSWFGYGTPELRLPATIANWLSLVPFFLACRALTSGPPALFATALMAVSRWHTQMSWYDDEGYVAVWWFVLVLWALTKAATQARPLWYVLLGALTGYSLYHYIPFRTALPLVLTYFALDFLRGNRPAGRGSMVAALAGVAFLFAVPLVERLKHDKPNYYTEPLARSMADEGYYTRDVSKFVTQRLTRMELATEMFTVSDHATFFETLNTRARPLLDPFSGAVFLLGLGTAAALPLRRNNLFLVASFLLLWLAVTTVTHNLDFRRLGILCPFTFLFMALFADGSLALARGPRSRAALAGLLLGIVVLSGWSNDRFLFRVLAVNPRTRAQHRNDYTTAGFYLLYHYRGEDVVLLTPADGFVPTNFFQPNDYSWIVPRGAKGRVVLHVEEVLDGPSLSTRHGTLVLIQRPFDLEDVAWRIRKAYPQAVCRLYRDDAETQRDLCACRIPPAAGGAADRAGVNAAGAEKAAPTKR
jgi:hypothetical protein